jgi:hypothetical protein
MQETINKLESFLISVPQLINDLSLEEAELKSAPSKWSKKEILGHLCDSAINNLQRFTEIQFEAKPYKIRRYQQDDLVTAIGYQQMPIQKVLELWLALNSQIIWVMKLQTKESLNYEIIVGDSEIKTLRWLMIDYVNHLEHHLAQIILGTH